MSNDRISAYARTLILNYGLASAGSGKYLTETVGELKAHISSLEQTALTREEATYIMDHPPKDGFPQSLYAKLRSVPKRTRTDA